MASSSHTATSEAPKWKYDVFLSFRGPETRKGITSELYDRLQKRGIRTFMDEKDLEVGDAISPTLLRAIEDSRFAIVVLSQNYASSPWCLKELTKICQCMEDTNRILPLFYHVDPTVVRYQKRSFEEAFTKHENSGRYGNEVQQWKDALNKVANLSGWHTLNYENDRQLVEAIVDNICSKIPLEIESTEDFEVFEATRQAGDEVMNALTNDKVTAIGVYGMGGVGKTALVKYIGQQAQARGLFERVIMVVISQSPEVSKIQDTLADRLGLKLEKKTAEARADELKAHILSRRSKILIFLDDIWAILNLSSIGIPSQKELQNCSSKVLLTTRRLNVCHVMKCQQTISLNILSKDDSWTLFFRNARVSFESTKLKDVAMRVAEECQGLPIALITLARALGDKDMEEWETSLRKLKNSQTANPDDEGDSFKCIKISYDYLKDEDYKSCFLLCCLFPEDYDIEIEDLFRYAIGKGLFSNAESIQESREVANSVVKHLKNSSLLLESENKKSVRMHDVIRDTAIRIAQDDHGFWVRTGSGVKIWPCRLHEGCSAISLMNHHIPELPKQLVYPKLELLFLNCYFLRSPKNFVLIRDYFSMSDKTMKKIPDTLFQISNKLRVLDLSQPHVCLLPQSLSLLTNLQTLHLNGCGFISNISLVGELKQLEILSMRFYKMGELPREIGDLINLRILDVSNGRIKKSPPGVISRLHKLEELYLQGVFCEWGSSFDEEEEQRDEEMNAGFDEVTSLSNLRHLKVCISDAECIPANVEFDPNWVWFNIWIGPHFEPEFYHKNSRSLHLDTPIDTFPDWFVNVVINKAEVLDYIHFQGLIDLCVEYDQGRLHGLKNLTVRDHYELDEDLSVSSDNLDEQMDSMEEPVSLLITGIPKEVVFENLEVLCLYNLCRSEVLFLSDLPHRSLINLKTLNLRDCRQWGSVLLPPKLLQRLPHLEKLTCISVCDMEYVFGWEGFEPEEFNLRELDLFDLKVIKSICDGPSPPAMFRNLERLSLISCSILGSLFTSDIVDCLFQLKFISLINCPFLERIIEAAINKKPTLRKLKELSFSSVPMLIGTIDFECPSLEDLYVEDCPKFSFSVSDFHSNKQVQVHLNKPWWRIEVEDIDVLKHLQNQRSLLNKAMRFLGYEG